MTEPVPVRIDLAEGELSAMAGVVVGKEAGGVNDDHAGRPGAFASTELRVVSIDRKCCDRMVLGRVDLSISS